MEKPLNYLISLTKQKIASTFQLVFCSVLFNKAPTSLTERGESLFKGHSNQLLLYDTQKFRIVTCKPSVVFPESIERVVLIKVVSEIPSNRKASSSGQ